MIWKKFSTVCTTSCLVVVLVAFPYNILGCGPDLNPYDYYTSFFRNGFSQHKQLQPFYYTNYRFLYDEQEPVPVKYVTSAEWTSYCGEPVKNTDAYPFVCQFAYKDLRNLYNHLEKNEPLQIPDSVRKNKMTGYFMQTKDLEALGYLMYAKQAEPFVSDEGWEAPNRDSAQMARLIKSGSQLFNAAGKEFIRYRYGYQVLRLYHYSGQYAACIKWYDEKMANINVQSELNALSLSLKAGAMARTGKRKESVYEFSKLFAKTDVKKISNYMSFRFTLNTKEDPQNYLALCRNSEERANMLAMMALGDPGDKLAVMTEIFRLAPQSSLLELLALREIHKWEDQYFSPKLSEQKGGSNFNTRWVNEEKVVPADQSEKLKSLSDLFHLIAQDKSVKTPTLFETGAAYLQIMLGNWQAAGTLLTSAEKMTMMPEMKDQWEMTRLLLTINEKKQIDPALETSLLPSLKWLEKKARTEKRSEINYYENGEWKQFFRNLLSEVIAKKYHAQGDLAKEALVIGAGEKFSWIPNNESEEEYYPYYGIFENKALRFLRYEMNSSQAEQLYALMTSSSPSAYEKFLLQKNTLTANNVMDYIGTAYLRENNLEKAIAGFKKIPEKYYRQDPYRTYLAANPFASLILDTHAPTKADTVTYTKLSFAQRMQELAKTANGPGSADDKAKAFYKLATGYYQMSYWGNSWLLLAYEWHTGDGLKKGNHQNWEKEYYGVYRAEQLYRKAYELSTDKNLKARCLFMAAKCAQKQALLPVYTEFREYGEYVKAIKRYEASYRKNDQYFGPLKKEYAATPFYIEVYNTCSYLKDFADKK